MAALCIDITRPPRINIGGAVAAGMAEWRNFVIFPRFFPIGTEFGRLILRTGGSQWAY